MTDRSSSFISYDTSSSRGPTGPTGPAGPMGNAGSTGNSGGTQSGPTGNRGKFIQDLRISNSSTDTGCTLHYIFSDQTTGEVSGAEIFRGPLLLTYEGVSYSSSLTPVNVCRGLSLDDSGGTKQAIFNFKDIISTSDAISVTSDSNFIYINATGGASTFTSTINGLAYKDKFEITTTNPNITGIGFSFDSNFGGLSGHYLHINGLSGSTNSIIFDRKVLTFNGNSTQLSHLNLTNYGVFNIRTPIGLAGFTGIPGSSGGTGTILSATLMFDSEDVWHFPQNILFRENENYLTAGGSTIIGIHSVNSGVTWAADIFGRGFPTSFPTSLALLEKNRWPRNIMGSLTGSVATGSVVDSSLKCIDYVTITTHTNITVNKQFKPLQICTSELTPCCIKGIFQEVPRHLCEKYKGRAFDRNVTCFDPCGTNSPGTTGSCCINQICNKRYTSTECANLSGAFTPGGTCASGCLAQVTQQSSTTGPTGACCHINLPVNCSITTQLECIENLGGVFSAGLACSDVNCNTVTNFNPTINTQYIPDITDDMVTKNIVLDLGGGTFDCITIVGTPQYLSQFKEC